MSQISKSGRTRRPAREPTKPRAPSEARGRDPAEKTGGGNQPVAPGAAFVGAAGGDVYYWVGSRGWQDIPPLERVWFPSEAAAHHAGYRRAASAWEGLDEFEIMGELGRGATSVVYHAWDRGLGREVAIKVIQGHFGADAETSLRFALEARLLASLRHPNVVSAFAVKQLPGGGFALVMEYVRGRTLREVIRDEGPLPAERVERILRDVAGALGAAHQHGIVHRDVKPDNVFLEESSGRALLADFGIAVNLDSPSGLTMLGTAVGTPNYMSPEQIDGARLDGRSDLYSLALIGWEMLTGEKPWQGGGLYSVIYKQKHEHLPTLKRVRTDVPVRLAYAIEGALAKEADARWGSAEAFVDRLTDRSLPARWRQLSAARLWKRRAAARVATGAARIQTAAVQTARTIFFRRPEHREMDPFPRSADAAPGPRGRLRRLALSGALVAVLLAVPAGLRPPFGGPPGVPEASAELPAADPGGEASGGTPSPPPDVFADASGPLPAEGSGAEPSVDVAAAVAALLLPVDSMPGSRPDGAPRVDAAGGAGTFALSDLSPAPEDPVPSLRAPEPRAATPLALPVARSRGRIAAGGMHTCEIDADQGVLCWGGNDRGQLGLGAPRRATSGVQVAAVSGVSAVEAGGFHTCALRALGTVLCWGENADGQLGGGTREAISLVRISTQRFTSIGLGTAHTCGVASDGSVYCWGANAHGQLGDGTSATRVAPTEVLLDVAVAVLSSGWNHTCVVTRQGRGLCWGDNESGQLGDGTTFDRFAPVSVAGDPLLRGVAAGSGHTCALTQAGEVLCWGQNSAGQLGDGSTVERHTPVSVASGNTFTEISAGGRHSCALDRSGTAYCWGQNNYGQLGTGSTEAHTVPTRVETDVRFATIRSSGAHTCGVSTDGVSYCWGYNVEGQVGDGTQTHRTTPQRVSR